VVTGIADSRRIAIRRRRNPLLLLLLLLLLRPSL